MSHPRKITTGVCKINARESSPRFSKMGRPPFPPDFNVGLQRGARGGAVPRARKGERGQKQKRAFILQDQNTPFRETTTLKSGGKGVARRRGDKLHFRGPRTRLRAGHKVSGVYFANTGPPCALQTQNRRGPLLPQRERRFSSFSSFPFLLASFSFPSRSRAGPPCPSPSFSVVALPLSRAAWLVWLPGLVAGRA